MFDELELLYADEFAALGMLDADDLEVMNDNQEQHDRDNEVYYDA